MNVPQPSFFQQLAAIIMNTFREAVRDRILYNLVIFVLMITVAAVFLGELTAGQEARVIVNLGLTSILLFGAFIAIFVGVSIVWKEIEKRTVYAIFSKPVGRSTFLVGKYLGLVLTLFVNLAVMALGVTLALIFVGGSHLIAPMLSSAVLIGFELTVITAVAVMFSSFSTPALSALLTFFVFLIGHFSASLLDFARGIGSAAVAIFSAIYYALPNFSYFSFITQSSNGEIATPAMIGIAAVYAVVFDVILMSIATAVFSLRNFK
jgi:ABC-type transport system involved in multi-copper enzyme maturation permease subunit